MLCCQFRPTPSVAALAQRTSSGSQWVSGMKSWTCCRGTEQVSVLVSKLSLQAGCPINHLLPDVISRLCDPEAPEEKHPYTIMK